MVTNVNVTLDDSTAAELRDIKDDLGLTWAELLEKGGWCLHERAHGGSETVEPDNRDIETQVRDAIDADE
jgi:hypothetical protein